METMRLRAVIRPEKIYREKERNQVSFEPLQQQQNQCFIIFVGGSKFAWSCWYSFHIYLFPIFVCIFFRERNDGSCDLGAKIKEVQIKCHKK